MAAIKNDKLNILFSAVMALPGLCQTVSQSVQAAEVGVRSDAVKLDYNHAYYEESGDRMQVDVDQLSVVAPIANDFELKFDTIRDAISGASPVMYLPHPSGEIPIKIMQAGASIRDVRNVYDVEVGYYGDNKYISAKIGRSKENDYIANFANANYMQYLNNKNTSLLFSYAQSKDSFWNEYFPAGSAQFDPFLDPKVVRDRDQKDFQFSVGQVLDTDSRIEFSISSVNNNGNLSDPYKKVYVNSAGSFLNIPQTYLDMGGTPEILEAFILDAKLGSFNQALRESLGIYNDARPTDRDQLIYLIRYSRYLASADAAMHIDYRHALDSWGARSQTIEGKWRQSLPWGVIVTPGIRYYSQDNADFYDTSFTTTSSDFINDFVNTHHTSDYRLAGFGSMSYKLAVDKTFMDKLSLRLSYEYYKRDFDLAWNKSSKGSAVDDYHYRLISLSISYLFK